MKTSNWLKIQELLKNEFVVIEEPHFPNIASLLQEQSKL